MNRKSRLSFITVLILFSSIFSACQLLPAKTPTIPSGEAVPDGPVLVTGEFEYTNEFVVETYYVEHAVGLLDMTGFVERDQEWEMPVEGQVLGYMDLDADNNRASFRLSLPAVPEGLFNDVDQDGKSDKGLQIFTVGYNPNLTGGVFSEGDDRSLGWPSYLASVKTDTENQDEVTGGQMIIWAADGEQEFPSGFGADGLLFTDDDPQMSVPAGYSLIDLDKEPFAINRDSVVEVTLYEPEDIAVKDFSDLSYTEAFESMFNIASKEYAFNGIEGKAPDWDALYAMTAPKIAEAEDERDAYGYYLALREFTMSFNDGHVGLSGGDLESYYNQNSVLGGYGFSVRELDDGRVIVVYVLEGSPAAQAGMQVGAELIEFNGKDVQTALNEVAPFEPQSTDFGLRYEQTIFLTRGAVGETAIARFENPGQSPRTESLTSIYELDSLYYVYRGGSYDDYALPVEYQYDSYYGIGYIRINSNYDDLGLAVRIFGRAVDIFDEAGAIGIIIDMRHNYGGSPLGLAGFLYDEDIPLGQLEYYSDKTGQFEPEGPRDKVFPNVEQYSFDNMVLLVDQFCYSACEIEAYGFSQVPGMVVMGQFPSAGVEAETARGDFVLPEGIEMTIPTGRFTLPDGSIFLEGQGVQPTLRLPVNEESVLSDTDVVLEEAYNYILSQ
jgi:C-terminal processing protease CtpA/Prc